MSIFSKIRHFFKSIHLIYWFLLGLACIIGGSSFYYFTHFSFRPSFATKPVLQLQAAGHEIIARASDFRKKIQSNILKVKHMPFKKLAKKPAKEANMPIDTNIMPSSAQSENHRTNIMAEDMTTALETKIARLSNNMESIQNKVIYLENAVEQLEKKLQDNNEYTATKQTADNRKEKTKINLAQTTQLQDEQAPLITIESIHAIIPGRVWLNLQDGQMMTAGIGSYIPHYGTVRLIDPNRGLIQFSSGKVIYLNTKEY